MKKRTGPRKKALEIAKYFRDEQPDYRYIRSVFVELRKELNVDVNPAPKAIDIPSEEDIRKFYEVVWEDKNMQDVLMVKLLIYTGIRISELIRIKLEDVNLDECYIEIATLGRKKGRKVPFSKVFRKC